VCRPRTARRSPSDAPPSGSFSFTALGRRISGRASYSRVSHHERQQGRIGRDRRQRPHRTRSAAAPASARAPPSGCATATVRSSGR